MVGAGGGLHHPPCHALLLDAAADHGPDDTDGRDGGKGTAHHQPSAASKGGRLCSFALHCSKVYLLSQCCKLFAVTVRLCLYTSHFCEVFALRLCLYTSHFCEVFAVRLCLYTSHCCEVFALRLCLYTSHFCEVFALRLCLYTSHCCEVFALRLFLYTSQ